MTKLSKPTNFRKRFVSKPVKSKKLNTKDVNPGRTLKTKKINFLEGNSRVNNLSELETEINENKPTHIISLIGRTHGKINEIQLIEYFFLRWLFVCDRWI